MRIVIIALVTLGGALSTLDGETVTPQALPLCNAIDFSDEKIQAAVDRAIRKGSEAGVHADSINSPDFIVIFRQMASELGCRLPDGNAPTSQLQNGRPPVSSPR